MADRRPLLDGLKPVTPPVDPGVERAFVFGGEKPPRELPVPPERVSSPPDRSRVTTRIRADFAAALKRASLERQLSGTTPNTLQEILEEALEPWLKTHGYIS
ncbi:MAG TPA: hypothetical protein VH092_37720 [Urbifossiella sp.]|jgi:hypothetical protein|nr:hypothetical protein [Urbifossiella sp.]